VLISPFPFRVGGGARLYPTVPAITAVRPGEGRTRTRIKIELGSLSVRAVCSITHSRAVTVQRRRLELEVHILYVTYRIRGGYAAHVYKQIYQNKRETRIVSEPGTSAPRPGRVYIVYNLRLSSPRHACYSDPCVHESD
jgi:hypothetical protein